jgi:hypothetical protein
MCLKDTAWDPGSPTFLRSNHWRKDIQSTTNKTAFPKQKSFDAWSPFSVKVRLDGCAMLTTKTTRSILALLNLISESLK